MGQGHTATCLGEPSEAFPHLPVPQAFRPRTWWRRASPAVGAAVFAQEPPPEMAPLANIAYNSPPVPILHLSDPARRAIVALLFLGLALVGSAPLLDQDGCSGKAANGTCGMSDQGGACNDEQECDHCLGCVVAHGHIQSLVPQTGGYFHTSSSIALNWVGGIEISDPRPACGHAW